VISCTLASGAEQVLPHPVGLADEADAASLDAELEHGVSGGGPRAIDDRASGGGAPLVGASDVAD